MNNDFLSYKASKTNELASRVLGFVIMLLLVLAFYIGFWVFTPVTRWFEYYKVVPKNLVVMAGEDLEFISHRVYNRPFHVRFRDSLRCKFGNGKVNSFSLFSYYESDFEVTKTGESEKSWFYQGHVPDRAGECYLETKICVDNPLDIEKCQLLEGLVIEILE